MKRMTDWVVGMMLIGLMVCAGTGCKKPSQEEVVETPPVEDSKPAVTGIELEEMVKQIQELSARLEQLQSEVAERPDIVAAEASLEAAIREDMLALTPAAADLFARRDELQAALEAKGDPRHLAAEDIDGFRVIYEERTAIDQDLASMRRRVMRQPEHESAQQALQELRSQAMHEADAEASALMAERDKLRRRHSEAVRQITGQEVQ